MSDLTKIALTGADFADLAAGYSFNTMTEDGDEIVLYGDDFSDAEISKLAAGETVEHDSGRDSYLISAPEEPWVGHRA